MSQKLYNGFPFVRVESLAACRRAQQLLQAKGVSYRIRVQRRRNRPPGYYLLVLSDGR